MKDPLTTRQETKNGVPPTLDRHQLGIPDESLSPLHQEVVALARGLDIGYIWIDALCIIQDSDKDKDKELRKMCDIYRGALVVVVAASAESPQNSLLTVKRQSHTWRTASPLKGYEEVDLNVKFRVRDWFGHIYTDATRGTLISERAWCFQEKLLASRCLIFSRDEVVWECRSCCRCQCRGEQEHFSVGTASDFPRPMQRYQQMLLPLVDQTLTAFAQLPFARHEPVQLGGTPKHFANAEEAYSFWGTAVENYSQRALSEKTDRLPAISAVASVIAEAIGDPTGESYLAGLWRGDLLAGLAWIARRSQPRTHQGYIAPTWSWASLPGGAWYPDRTRHWRGADQAKVVNASTVLKDFGPSGGLYGPMSEVADGAIVLSGVHCDVAVTILDDGSEVQLNFENGEGETVLLTRYYDVENWLDYMRVKPDNNNIDQLRGNSRYLRRVGNTRGYEQPECSGTVHFLWLKEDISLILTTSLEKEGAYERLGIFHPKLRGSEEIPIKSPNMPKWVQRSEIKLV